MTKSVANVSISTDTFAGWVGKTNIILDALTNEIVTVNSSTAGSNSVGNGSVVGVFAANVISTPTVRGGASGNTANVQTLNLGWSNSTVSSNVVVTGYAANITSNTLTVSSNTTLSGAALAVSSNTAFTGSSITASSNVYISGANTTIDNTTTLGALRVSGNTSVNTNINFANNNAILSHSANYYAFPTDNTTSNTILVIPKALAKSGKISITGVDTTTANANNRMFTEISFVYFDDGSSNTVYFTEYGMIFNDTRFLTFNMTTNAANINLIAVSNASVTNTQIILNSNLHK